MYTQLNQYHVVMEVAPEYWQRPETLKDLYLQSPNGEMVPLSVFSEYKQSTTSLAVNHYGQTPDVTISFNLPPRVSLGDAVNAIEDVANKIRLPAGIRSTFLGSAQAFKDSLANEPFLVLAALIAVYIVLGILYESYIHPITILSTLPSAGVGAFLALLIFHTDLDIISLIGVILLIGLVKKNGILMVDFAIDAERNEGKTPAEAIYQACLLRFRPIMMTTMAAMLGALPLALGMGMGFRAKASAGDINHRRAYPEPASNSLYDAGDISVDGPFQNKNFRGERLKDEKKTFNPYGYFSHQGGIFFPLPCGFCGRMRDGAELCKASGSGAEKL